MDVIWFLIEIYLDLSIFNVVTLIHENGIRRFKACYYS